MVDGYLLYVNWRNNHNHRIVCAPSNPVLRCCTCPVGVSGASCKHQRAVLGAVDVVEAGPARRTPELRRLFYEIACG